jgi:hypothetical protein
MTIQEQLNNFKGSQIIGIDTLTVVELTGGKSNHMQGKVKKLVEGSQVMIFKNGKGYFNMVSRRLEQQFKELRIRTTIQIFEAIDGKKWEPGPRQWGERVPNSPFVSHKDKTYLECIFLRPGSVKYFLDGVEIPKDQIIGLKEKVEGEQGGLVDKVIIRTYGLDSIVRVRKSKKEILGPALLK